MKLQLDTRFLTISIALLIAVLTAALIMVRLQSVISFDCVLYMVFGRLILLGHVPFIDLFDINPPLIMYLNVVPALMASVFHLDLVTAFVLCFSGLVAISAYLCLFLLSRNGSDDLAISWLIVPALMLSCFLPLLEIGFGQRDHVYVLCYLPFFFLRWLRWRGISIAISISILIGVLAGIGICLKPIFLLAPVAVEIYWLIQVRKWRNLFSIEVLSCAAVGIAYLLHFLLMPPALRDNFFNFIVPLVKLGYSAFDAPLREAITLHDYRQQGVFMLVTVMFAIILRKKHGLLMPLCVFVVFSYFAFLLQHKNWPNHLLPAYVGSFILAGLELGILFHCWQATRIGLAQYIARLGGMCSLLACFLALGEAGLLMQNAVAGRAIDDYRQRAQDPLRQFVLRETKANDTVLLLDPDGGGKVASIFTGTERLPGSRYLYVFPLVLIEYARQRVNSEVGRAQLLSLENRFIAGLADDIKKYQPRLILIPTQHRNYCPPDFSVQDYFHSKDQIDSLIRSKYALIGSVSGDMVYVLK